jgi:hypothetical protein
MTAVYFFVLIWGLGAWLPTPTDARQDWLGFSFLVGWLTLVVALYIGTVLLGLALSTTLVMLIGVSVAGVLNQAYRNGLNWRGYAAQFRHPLWVLFFLVLGVGLVNGGFIYLPMPGDETASWLRLARQIFLVDAYWSDKVDYHLGAYTDG